MVLIKKVANSGSTENGNVNDSDKYFTDSCIDSKMIA